METFSQENSIILNKTQASVLPTNLTKSNNEDDDDVDDDDDDDDDNDMALQEVKANDSNSSCFKRAKYLMLEYLKRVNLN
jgi:hypothetical protein